MEPRTWAFSIFVFLIIFGFLLQLLGIVNGPLNIANLNQMQGTLELSLCLPSRTIPGTNITMGGQCLFQLQAPRFPISVLSKFLIMVVAMLSVYYGTTAFIGLVRGATPFSMGFDLMILIKIIAIAFVYTVISPVFDIFAVFYSLGDVGKILAIFIGILYFFSAFSILYSQTQ